MSAKMHIHYHVEMDLEEVVNLFSTEQTPEELLPEEL